MFRPVALLNDDTTEVGAVHLGVVFVADAAGRPVTVRETRQAERGVRDRPPRSRPAPTHLETWSRLVFDALESGVIAPREPVGT